MPDEEVIDATQTAHGYLVSPLSEHINETPEGFLVVVGCPIARTGWQTYAVRDLPQESAKAMGIDLSNPSAEIELYRPEEEVFDPEFLASLNGKPIVDGHPPGFVTPDNYSQYAMGHIQNPRRGEQLEDGEWPVIADLVISAEPLIGKVRNKIARDVSLGYDYGIERDGARINQCSMIGNHAAVVPKGRAGDLIAIGDAAEVSTRAAPPEPAASPPEPSAGHAALTNNELQPKKEKPKVKNIFHDLLGRGLKAFAADSETSPEELAQAAMDVGKHARDGEITTDPEQQAIDRARRGRDKDPEFGPDIEETETQDAAARRRAHDDLDEMLDARGKRGARDNRRGAKDADVAALRDLINDYLGEEEQEPEHQEDADPSELEEVLGGGEEPDAEDGELCGCGDPACPGGCALDVEADPGEELEPSGEEELAEDRAGAADAYTVVGSGRGTTAPVARRTAPVRERANGVDAVKATLRMLRPFVARANDAKLNKAFNTALGSVSKASRANNGGYGEFAGAARGGERPRNPNPLLSRARAADGADPTAKLQKYYDERRKGGK